MYRRFWFVGVALPILGLALAGWATQSLAQEAKDKPKPESKEKDLWNSPGVFLLFALLITVEWVLRKKFRLL